MLIEAEIDWFTGSLPTDQANNVMFGARRDWIPSFGMSGYDVAHTDATTGIKRMVSTSRADMGTAFVATSQNLRRLAETYNNPSVLSSLIHAGFDRCRCSRIDLCIDIYDAGASAHDVARNALEGLTEQTARKVTVVQSAKGDGGCTTYFGSRQSQKFVRVYDKDAESHGERSCTRLECEMHGRTAAEVWQRLAAGAKTSQIGVMAGNAIRSVVTYFANETIELALAGRHTLDLDEREASVMLDTDWIDRQLVSYFARNALENEGETVLLNYLTRQVFKRIVAQ
jgi:hypothetical protein